MTDSYEIGGILPDDTIDELRPGTNVAVIGSSHSGKRHVALQLVAAGYDVDEGILCITTNSARRVFEDLDRHIDAMNRDRIGVIDCSGTGGGSVIEAMTESASSPGDLTGISIGTAKLSKRFHSRGVSDIRYGLVSISTLLQYVDESTVFRFLHVFTNRVSETDGLGVYTLTDDTHDATTVNTIRGQFDGVVELRERDDGTRECRVRGLGSAPSGWNVFE
ncbi:hypothetical protein Halru_0138 [Halovivax ruber XH-70]|uniref:RecA-superfamily ATPase possibly involved in signal transduction n=1 Tax=Halovivax ruber (strain DSM 18193 / JCM 13892 / XH-70) TaxID=797302 RepID=L0I5K9_HALRX|nr:hypothetical protein [Halovivax ruber]AGB14790.1 hypothetical protein Halru_0138 [Halovivax ruber XH-70]